MSMSCHVSGVRVTTISLSLIEEVITMSEADVFAKLRWYQLRAMESPLGSEERVTWTAILRDLEEFKNRLTTASTVAIQANM